MSSNQPNAPTKLGMTEAILIKELDACATFNREELCREVEAFHQTIFGRSAPEDIREAFVEAIEMLLKHAERPITTVDIDLIIRRSLDIEAIELVLRRKNPKNILTKKLLILCYLTESRSAYFSIFVNEQHRPVRTIIKLSFDICRSIYKLLKGHCLIRMYDVI